MLMIDSYADVATKAYTKHQGLYMGLANKEIARQLKVCTSAWMEWLGGTDKPAMFYADFSEIAWHACVMDKDMDDLVWAECFSQPKGLERIFQPTFAKLEVRRYDTKEEFLHAVREGFKALTDDERKTATLRSTDLLLRAEPAPAQNGVGPEAAGPEAWTLLTFGELRRSPTANLTVAFLEGHQVGQARVMHYHDSKLFDSLKVACKTNGYAIGDESDEARRMGLLKCLSEVLVLGPAYNAYSPPNQRYAALEVYVNTCTKDAPGDGKSALAQRSTKALVAIFAPTVHHIVRGIRMQKEFNDALVDIAFPLMGESMCAEERLFTPFGVRALQRASSNFKEWARSPEVTDLLPADRLEQFLLKLQAAKSPLGGLGTNVSALGGSGGGGGGGLLGGGGGGGGRYGGEGLRIAIMRARELGDTPHIIEDVIDLISVDGHDPLDVLQLLFTGEVMKEGKKITRKPTALTLLLAWDRLHAPMLDSRLAPVRMYSRHNGGRYLGRAIGRRLAKAGYCLEADVKTLSFPELFDVLRGPDKDWKAHLDLYNLLLVPLVRQVQCAGALNDTEVSAVPKAHVYLDMLLNLRLPRLASWMFQAVGVPADGPDSFREVLDGANGFALFNCGVTATSTRLIMSKVGKLCVDYLGEAFQFHEPHRDVANLDAPVNSTFVRCSSDEGARGEFKVFKASFLKKVGERRDAAYTEELPPQVDMPGLASFATALKRDSDVVAVAANKKGRRGDDAAATAAKPDDEAATKAKGDAEAARLERERAANQSRDYSNADSGFRAGGSEWFIKTSDGKHETVYDAKAAKAEWGDDVCLPYVFSVGLPGAPNCCPKPGSPDHSADGKCHVIPTGKRGRAAFNLKAAGGRGGGKGAGGKAGRAGKGKGKGKPKK